MTARRLRLAAAALLVSLLVGAPSFSQEPRQEMEKEIELLKKGQEELRKELAEIKRQLQTPAAARPAAPDLRDVELTIGAYPVQGESTAPLTLVEFTDYQCPYCARHVRETAPLLEEQYIATGKLRYVVVDLPLAMHKLAFKAAEAAACAGDQGRYWDMHARLFDNQRQLEPWAAHAEALSLDGDLFAQCLESGRFAPAIRTGMSLARRLSITGTPSFVLAVTDPEDPGKAQGLSLIRGARPFADFKGQIDGALDELKKP